MNVIFRIILTVWIGLLFGNFPVDAAVDFRAGVNRDTITIGDPIVFRMRLLRDANDVTTFEWGEAFPKPFEIIEKHSAQSISLDDGRIQETTDVILTIFQVGEYDIPSVALRYVLANGDSGRVASRAIPVLIQSVKASGETDIRDVKPPLEIEPQIPMWAWLSLIALLACLVVLIWWLRKRKQRPEVVPPPPPIDWMVELEKVREMNLVAQGKFKVYYSLLSDIVRRCLEAKTSVRAVEETTFEIKRDLLTDGVDEGFVLKVEAFLIQADMVKFAKFTPPPDAVDGALPAVEQILNVLIQPQIEADTSTGGSVPS